MPLDGAMTSAAPGARESRPRSPRFLDAESTAASTAVERRHACRAIDAERQRWRSPLEERLEKVRAGHDGILRDGRALGGSGAALRRAIWHHPGGALGSMLM